MKDDETGVEPASSDGEGASDDELERRRRGGSAKQRGEQQQVADAGEPGDGTGEEDDGQLFVWERGRKVTLGTLIARGTAVEHVFVFGGRRTKGAGGLMSFEDTPLLIVRGKPGPVRVVPTRDDDEKVTKVTVESHVEARIVTNADSEEGLGMIGHILDERGYKRPPAQAA